MINSPPASNRRPSPSASLLTDDTARPSVETAKITRSPFPSKKPLPKQVQNIDNHSDDADRDSYFDQSPAPSQFLGTRGRPLSFYDMKEQQKQTRPGVTPKSLRNSWRASVEMPYNYADIIGDNRGGYAPPRLGRQQTQRNPPIPDASNIYLGLPWTMWMNSEFKNLFVAALGEWVGTTLFLFFAFAGTQVANAHSKTPSESTTTNATAGFSPIVILYISVSFGFSLMVNVWIFFRISGGLFNPAVSLPVLYRCNFTDNPGHLCIMGHWCCWCHSRCVPLCIPDCRQHHRVCLGPRHVSYSVKRPHNSF